MTEKDFYLKVLESAIFIRHECKATHRDTVIVQETTQEKETFWTGQVEVFDLAWHETARICYAWVHISENEPPKIFALPGNQLVDSPQRAVQAAIFADARPIIPPTSVSSKLVSWGTCAAKSTAATVEVLVMAQGKPNGTHHNLPLHP